MKNIHPDLKELFDCDIDMAKIPDELLIKYNEKFHFLDYLAKYHQMEKWYKLFLKETNSEGET